MRVPFTLGLVALSCLSSGCTLFSDSAALLMSNVRQSVDNCHEKQRNERWAAAAWDEVWQDHPGQGYSEDYADGFKFGFADYLYRGGNGDPPLVAPARYRRLTYQTAAGYVAIQDWFAGCRHGTAAAKQSGLRRWVTGPTSLLPVEAKLLSPSTGTGAELKLTPPLPASSLPDDNRGQGCGARLGRPSPALPVTSGAAREADILLPLPRDVGAGVPPARAGGTPAPTVERIPE